MAKVTAENFESNVDYTTVLNNFEGPLDLLLYLIRCNEIEIKDIFVSQVMEQFMAYMRGLPYLDADKASEYLVIASTILSIKAKSLVPDEEEEDFMDDEEDERTQLIRALEEYKLIKEEAEKLKAMETVGYFYKEPDKSVGQVKIVYKDFNLDGLVRAFTELMLRIEAEKHDESDIKEIPQDTFTVAEKIAAVREILSERESVQFEELLSRRYNKTEVITTFQALLELLKHQYICVTQEEVFAPILIMLNPERNEEEDFGEIDEYN